MTKLVAGAVAVFFAVACADRPMEPQSLVAISDAPAFARVGPPGPCCYEDGRVLRTAVPPSSFPNEGRDPIYSFTNGVNGQLAVISAGPGDGNYHGGSWAVHTVTWNVAPYLITSDEQLFAAKEAGEVTIKRVPEADFRCPVQP